MLLRQPPYKQIPLSIFCCERRFFKKTKRCLFDGEFVKYCCVKIGHALSAEDNLEAWYKATTLENKLRKRLVDVHSVEAEKERVQVLNEDTVIWK
jgi:hypothetical protein